MSKTAKKVTTPAQPAPTGQPTPPKRPMSAYFLFLNDIRSELKKEHPSASVAEISKYAGERWGVADTKTKSKYEKMQEEVKKEYIKKKADYETEHGPIVKEKKQKVSRAEKSDKRGGKKAGTKK